MERVVEVYTIKVIKLPNCYALPEYKSLGAAAMDIYSAEDVIIPGHDKDKVSTGIKVAIPYGYELIITDRSSKYIKQHLSVSGTVDADYRGEIFVMVHNHSEATCVIKRGDRIAQLKLRKCLPIQFEEVNSLDDTERGAGGFGHTGG